MSDLPASAAIDAAPDPVSFVLSSCERARAALSADFASPLANSGPAGIDYINADLTLHLGRLPEGEWIGTGGPLIKGRLDAPSAPRVVRPPLPGPADR